MKYVKFIAKPYQWYKEGTEAFIDTNYPNQNAFHRFTVEEFEAYKKVHEGWDSGLFVGRRFLYNEGYERIDGELCSLDEFDIIETDEPLSFVTEEELDKFYNRNSN
jgi:hypothetical protein